MTIYEVNVSMFKYFDFIAARVASYKYLRGGLFIAQSLPKGKTGKILRDEAAKINNSIDH